MIERIHQSQKQLSEVTETALLKDYDGLETNAQNTAQQAFPGGNWPDNLSPWP
jgi:hypothetical protein